MIVICRSNRIGEELVSTCKRAGCSRFWGKGMHAFDLTEGKAYVVYSLRKDALGVWYYIADDDYPQVWYPNAYPAQMFQVRDLRISQLWRSGCQCATDGGCVTIQSFDEWMQDESFYERLVEGDDEGVKRLFRSKKEFMDLEFTSEIAEGLVEDMGQGWGACSRCGDYFEYAMKETEMVRCPACGKILAFHRMMGK